MVESPNQEVPNQETSKAQYCWPVTVANIRQSRK